MASLIRQESEFNPSAISKANAYGLMQLLPSAGKAMAREEGISHFETYQLLDPETNIRLGTRYLRKTMDKFGGVAEYALAAYNAGDDRVVDWQAAGPYQRHRRVCGVYSIHRDPRICPGDPSQRGDLQSDRCLCRSAGQGGGGIQIRGRIPWAGRGIPLDTPHVRFRLTSTGCSPEHEEQ